MIASKPVLFFLAGIVLALTLHLTACDDEKSSVANFPAFTPTPYLPCGLGYSMPEFKLDLRGWHASLDGLGHFGDSMERGFAPPEDGNYVLELLYNSGHDYQVYTSPTCEQYEIPRNIECIPATENQHLFIPLNGLHKWDPVFVLVLNHCAEAGTYGFEFLVHNQ
jgi:hypothetical protein